MSVFFLSTIVFACGIPFVGAADGVSAATAAPAALASGDGSIKFGKDGHGVGYFNFDVTASPRPSGSLLFAAEDHHLYPHDIVRASNITKATFGRRTAEFSGTGALHDTPVSIKVTIFDGNGTDRPDRFSILCTDKQGRVVLHAEGDVFVGSLVVGAEK